MATRDSDVLEVAGGLLTTSCRVESFESAHTVKDKSASTAKKRTATSVTWPHKLPDVELLASAGFYYKPTYEYKDSTKCFTCNVCVDGWEESDDPIDVHFQFAPHCAWAVHLALCKRLRANGEDVDNERDPMADELVEARTATFGSNWPYENKKGWKGKVKKMVEAGWCYDPSPEYNDGVHCFYCDLMLDGWEPKDDPRVEHLKRRPDCPFFVLKDRHAAERKASKTKKGRNSRVSKASRLSTLSVGTSFSEAPSIMSLGDDGAMSDDSVITTATTASRATKGRKTSRAQTAGTRRTSRSTRTKAAIEDTQLDDYSQLELNQSLYPDLSMAAVEAEKPKRKTRKAAVNAADTTVIESSNMDSQFPTEAAPAKKLRGRKAQSKLGDSQLDTQSQQIAEPAILDSQSVAPVKKKGGRAKKPQAKTGEDEADLVTEPLPETAVEENTVAEPRPKRARAKKGGDQESKIQAEANYEILNHSSVISVEIPVQALKPPRGTKRNSSGVPKDESSILHLEEAAEKVEESKPKRAKTRKAKKAIESQSEETLQQPAEEPAPRPTAKASKKPTGKGGKITKKASAVTTIVAPEAEVEPVAIREDDVQTERLRTPNADGQKDDRDVEMSDAYACNVGDFSEPPLRNTTPIFSPQAASPALSSPTPARHSSTKRGSRTLVVHKSPSAPGTPQSAQSSDAENKPPSSRLSSKRPPLPFAQSTSTRQNETTTHMPIATGTPTASPTKRVVLAPSNITRTPGGRNLIGNLKTTAPWTAADLEDIFLATPVRSIYAQDSKLQNAKVLAMREVDLPSLHDKENTPRARALLREVVSRVRVAMSKEERGMSVEEWVKAHALRGEERLKKECEALVGVFEREGLRAMVALEGVEAGV